MNEVTMGEDNQSNSTPDIETMHEDIEIKGPTSYTAITAGSMDVDETTEIYQQNESLSPQPQVEKAPQHRRGKRKVQRQKKTLDSKGYTSNYTITDMISAVITFPTKLTPDRTAIEDVYEWESYSEEELAQPMTRSKLNSTPENVETTKRNNKGKKNALVPGQKNILSFFGKR